MVEESRTNCDLAQPVPPKDSVDPHLLMEGAISGGFSGGAQSNDITKSLSNQELLSNSTGIASSPLTFEDVIFNDSMLLANTGMNGSNQAVSLSSTSLLGTSFEERRLHSQIRC